MNKLEVYRRLCVPEVWLWEKGALAVYALMGRTFKQVPRSKALPDLDLVQLMSFLERPTMTQSIRDYRTALSKSN